MSICILRNFRILQFSMHKFRILQGNLFRKLQIITLIFRKIQEKLFRLEFRKVQNSAKYNKPIGEMVSLSSSLSVIPSESIDDVTGRSLVTWCW